MGKHAPATSRHLKVVTTRPDLPVCAAVLAISRPQQVWRRAATLGLYGQRVEQPILRAQREKGARERKMLTLTNLMAEGRLPREAGERVKIKKLHEQRKMFTLTNPMAEGRLP